MLPPKFDLLYWGPGATIEVVKNRIAVWVVTILFGSLYILQVVKFGYMKLPIHLPFLLLVITGLVAGLLPSLKPIQSRLMFLSAYGSAFLLLWATGRPEAGLKVGLFWIATAGLVISILSVLAYVQHLNGKKPWSWAFMLAVVFGLFIAYASGPGGGPGWMSRMIEQIFGLGPEDWEVRSAILFWIRKTMHFVGYGSAAFCTAWAARKQGASLKAAILAGYAWPLPLAVFDEWQQHSSPTRTGSPWDVLLDFCGMSIFLFSFWLIWRNRSEQKENEI